MDYYTANIKAEVLFNTILTPIIGYILTIIGKKNEKIGIEGEMKLLAKEFPMLQEREVNYRNCNVDYLMCDKNSIYFVELKTTQESYRADQKNKYAKYLEYCIKGETFANTAGRDFIDLLNHVSTTGYSDKKRKKPWGESSKKDLKWLFETILNYPKDKGNTACPQDGWEEKENNHVDRAIFYLRNEKADSSKKYLLTAGQMLDHMKDGEWWDCKQIKLLYLMPKDFSEKQIGVYPQNNSIVVTFQKIVEQAYLISKEMEKWGLKNYWEWVMKILVQSGLC